MAPHRIISADSHIQEPEDLSDERLPAKFLSRVPQEEVRDGKRCYIVEGRKPRRLGVVPVADLPAAVPMWSGRRDSG